MTLIRDYKIQEQYKKKLELELEKAEKQVEDLKLMLKSLSKSLLLKTISIVSL